MPSFKRVRRLESGEVDPACEVAQAFAEAIRVAHDPNLCPDTDVACAALLEPLLRSGWWEAAIQLAWPGQYGPPARFHSEALGWWAGIRAGVSPPAFVACWPRDTGKSTVTKQCLALATGLRLRPYMMWISKIGKQVNDKVRDVGTLLQAPRMKLAFPEAAARYVDPTTGQAVDWREGRIRTANDVVIDAGGMDEALRGALVRDDRPGIIVLDDIESNLDTKYMREKKLAQITDTIIPMGSDDAAILFVQNQIYSASLMSSLLSGEAEWIADRVVSGPWPQIRGMEVEWEEENGIRLPVIVAGEATWPEERGIEASEAQMRKMGPPAFDREHNHNMEVAQGDMFDRELWGTIEAAPSGLRMARAWDLAASEDDSADWTVGALFGVDVDSGRVFVVDVVRGRWLGGRVEEIVAATADQDRADYGRCQVLIESQPAAAGKRWNERWVKEILPSHRVEMMPTAGGKVFRADGYSAAQQKGLLTLVAGGWNGEWLAEHALFTAKGTLGKHDDQVDAGAMAFNWLTGKARRGRGSVATAAQRTIG